jgi:hypothetical protein
MATLTDPKESSKSLSPPSYDDEDEDHAMDSIVVESGPISPLPPPDGLSPPPQGQEDTFMRTLTDEEEEVLSDDEDGPDNEVDDEDEESELLLDVNDVPTEQIVPIKPEDEQDHDSTREMSENSISMNDVAMKSDLGESMTRGGKLRRLAPPHKKRHKPSMGRSRTPRAPSPVIPPRSSSPWPEVQESDIRNDEDRDNKRRRTSNKQETNGTKESTPQPQASRSLRSQQGKEDSFLSAEERMKRSKRVKISPRKEKQQPNRSRSPPHPLTVALAQETATSGNGTSKIIFNVKADREDPDPTRYNEEICGACGGPGRFLCCEGCPKSFHFTCLDPPIDENDLPEDSWYYSHDKVNVGIVIRVEHTVIRPRRVKIVSSLNSSIK